MTMFLGDLAVMSELAMVALGLIVWHYGQKEPSRMFKVAAWILILGGLGGSVCSIYYLNKYRLNGEVEHAHCMMSNSHEM